LQTIIGPSFTATTADPSLNALGSSQISELFFTPFAPPPPPPAVSEPSTLALLGRGTAALAVWRRRRSA
jgi:hypothetical protein